MLNPEKHDRGPEWEHDSYACPEWILGSYFTGPTRISLVDTLTAHVLNTVKLVSEGKDEFHVPYRMAPQYYYRVPGPLHRGEGRPELLYLRDYNGDGEALEAPFFVAEACMGLGTTLIGYSTRQDRVIQYWIELTQGRKKRFKKWIDYLFTEKPQRPGYWKYEIDYRGRDGFLINMKCGTIPRWSVSTEP